MIRPIRADHTFFFKWLLRLIHALTLRSQQRIVATVEDSVLRTEMDGLESQEEDVPIVSSSLSR
jgi:hypothetical protein